MIFLNVILCFCIEYILRSKTNNTTYPVKEILKLQFTVLYSILFKWEWLCMPIFYQYRHFILCYLTLYLFLLSFIFAFFLWNVGKVYEYTRVVEGHVLTVQIFKDVLYDFKSLFSNEWPIQYRSRMWFSKKFNISFHTCLAPSGIQLSLNI